MKKIPFSRSQPIIIKKIIFTFLISLCFFSCSKMQDKKTSEENKSPATNSSGSGNEDNNSGMEKKSSGMTDEKATELSKSADDALTKYSTDKSDGTKKEVIVKCLAAANYLTYEATLPPKEKYRPALKYYKKVLEVDPKNEDALKNKNQIEDIYKSMGLPIPQ